MPEKRLKELYNGISRQQRICFFAAVIFGFITHFYKITNWLPNWDSLVFRYDAQNMLPLGRWFLSFACAASSFYDLPWVNGVLSILFHSLGAVCICRIFDIKKGITAALIGAITVTIPTVASVMMYNYVADGYALAFLFSCMAAMFLTAEKPKYFLSVILFMLSIAVYQAYISVAVVLVLIYLIDGIVFKRDSAKVSLKKGSKCAVCGIAGFLLYYTVTEILLKISQTTLLDYQYFGRTMSFSEINIPASLYEVKEIMIRYFFDFSNGFNLFSVLNIIILMVAAALLLLGAAKNGVFGKMSKTVLLAVYVLLLPIGMNILVFATPSLDYHNLMKMGYCVIYIFFVILYERIEFSAENAAVLKSWVILIAASVFIFNNIIIANVSYHKLQISYEKSYGTLIRIADRIEQTAGAENCDKILVIGALSGSEAYSADLPPDMTGTTDGYILRFDDESVGQSVLCSALNDYCGKNYKFLAGAEKRKLMKNTVISAMDYWPGENAVAVADGTVVIKLGAERE